LSLEEVEVEPFAVVVVDGRSESAVCCLLLFGALEVLGLDLRILVELLVARRLLEFEVADLRFVDSSAPA
jgi:hypothetical protein